MTDQDAEDAYNEMVRQEQEQMMTQSQEELGSARHRSSPARPSGSELTRQQASETPIKDDNQDKQHSTGVCSQLCIVVLRTGVFPEIPTPPSVGGVK